MAKDLDRFINGEICLEEIKGYVHGHVPIENAIINALTNALFYKNEHDLYEKLCFASVLRTLGIFKQTEGAYLYGRYLALKDKCRPHKLNWACLLRKIKKESNMNKYEMEEGESNYNYYKRTGGWPLDYDDPG